jgi:hypothetical protein
VTLLAGPDDDAKNAISHHERVRAHSERVCARLERIHSIPVRRSETKIDNFRTTSDNFGRFSTTFADAPALLHRSNQLPRGGNKEDQGTRGCEADHGTEAGTMNLDLLEAFVAAAADLTAMFAARASGSVTPTASTQPPTPSGAHGPQVKTVRRHPHPAHEEGYIASIKPLFNARQIPLLASFDRAAAALTRVSR